MFQSNVGGMIPAWRALFSDPVLSAFGGVHFICAIDDIINRYHCFWNNYFQLNRRASLLKRGRIGKNLFRITGIMLCFILIAAALPIHPIAAAEDSELRTDLLNPGFEMEAANGEIPGWSADPSTAEYGTASISSDYARSGTYSLLFEDKTAGVQPSGHFRVLSNPIVVSEHVTVTFDTYVYKAAAGDQSHGIQPVIHFYDQSGKEITPNAFVQYGKSNVPVGEWFQLTVTSEVPAGTAYVRVGLYSGFPSLTRVYMDDASVTIVSPDQEPPVIEEPITEEPIMISEKLLNPDFEAGWTEDGSIVGWTPDPTTGGIIRLSSDISLSGSNSLYFKDDSAETSTLIFSNAVTVNPGDSLIIGANVYVLQQTHNIVMQIYYYDANGKQVHFEQSLFSSNSLGSKKWSTMKLMSTVPEGAVFAKIALYSGVPSLTEAYFDDVSLTVLQPETPLDRKYQDPVNLGDMVYVNLGQAGAIQTNAAGENEVYFVTNGKPGIFFVLDGETGEIKFSEEIPNTTATWAMTIGTDKNVYFSGTEDGILYRYLPLEQRVEKLGYNSADNWSWDLEAIEGKIYGATFHAETYGKVYEYDIAAGKFRNYGAVEEGQQYVRGIAVDDKYIYAGLGTTIRLYKIDRVTGEKTEIPIPGYSGETGTVADVWIYNGKLFVSVSTINMVVLDMETGKIDAEFQYSNMISEPDPDDPNVVYYKYLNQFYKYDMSAKKSTEIELPSPLPDTTRVKDMAWIEMKSGKKAGQTVLAMVTQYGEYILIDPDDQWVSFVNLQLDAQPVNIQSMETGFDGRIYLGGYQRGMSIYNPFTDEIEINISSFPQPEGIGFLNGFVYYGTYVGAVMYRYDPSEPLDPNGNPKPVFDIEHQDRPFAITSGDNKLFVGTVPDYGYLGGALAVYDAKTDTWTQYNHDEVVKNQSIISLAYKDGLLYGGTSVWGGLGIEPSEDEAKIFVWDVEKGQKIDEFTLDGLDIDEKPRMIGAIKFGPDGLLWGIVDGTIFALNVETKEIVKSKMIRPSMYNSSKWLPYELEWAPDGTIYTTLSRQLYAIDPDTLRYQLITDEFVNNMTLGVDGSIYYAPGAGTSLVRIAVPETDATLSSLTVDGQPLEGFSPGILHYKAEIGSDAVIEAVPTQAGAVVDIEDLRALEQKVLIHVTGTDGISRLVYSIDTAGDEAEIPNDEDPDQDDEKSNRKKNDESDDSDQSAGSGTPDDSSASGDAGEHTLTLTVEDLIANEQGVIEVAIRDGINKILLPAQLPSLTKDQSIVFSNDNLSLAITVDTLAQFGALVPAEELEQSNLIINMETAEPQEALQSAGGKIGADIRLASSAYLIDLSLVKKDGTVLRPAEPVQGLAMSWPLSDDVDVELVGVYMLMEDGSITYIGGAVNGGKITVQVPGSGIYAALEINKTFTDVPDTHWAYDPIRIMAARFIVRGISDDEYAPDREITRAEFTALVTRSLGLDADSGPTPFNDVDPNSWYAQAVAAALEAGIVTGLSGTQFSPDLTITREEMAVILVRAYTYKQGSAEIDAQQSDFVDRDEISSWALNAVDFAYETGLVNGRGNQMFVPQGKLTRAEAAQALYNFLQKSGQS